MNIITSFVEDSVNSVVTLDQDYTPLWVNEIFMNSIDINIRRKNFTLQFSKAYYNSWYESNYSAFSQISDNNNTYNRLTNLSLVNVQVRAMTNFQQESGIAKILFYGAFDSDGLSMDYPPLYK